MEVHKSPSIDKRAVLITGCSSGIGLAAANTLHSRGFQVYATARKPPDVEKLRQSGLQSMLLDLTDPLSIENALAEVLHATNGKLYGLFNNGGFGQGGAVEDLPTAALREQFETLVFGWHELTRRVIPVMRAQGYGRIVQNSSVLGFAAMPYRGAYNAAKFAIEGLSDTLRLELRGSNIHVSIIQPGPIRSKFRENGQARFHRHINAADSVHASHYEHTLARLNSAGDASKFTLGPDAVVDKLLHALQHHSPRARYRVTTPTIAFAIAKRILPVSLLDRILAAIH
ncbi:short-chain dehydrogenase [Chromatiales bacterium (ex Bugula neritina AB1)]|nr:short-chain dehydrogenase [Chromatiales bacterium (ex Bugula neritina AB1)]